MPRRPLSSPATPAVAAVTQARWAVSIVASRCAGCPVGVEAGQRHLAVRRWEPGEVRARTEMWCEKCVAEWRDSALPTADAV